MASKRDRTKTPTPVVLEDPALKVALDELIERFADPYVAERGRAKASPAEVQRLRQLWDEIVSKWPLFPRRRFVKHLAGRLALGDDVSRRVQSQIDRQIARQNAVMPSAAWMESWGEDGTELPRHPEGRKHAVRMKRVKKSINSLPRRWTPPQCFEMETALDRNGHDGLDYTSSSALVIEQIAQRRATEAEWAGREHIPGTETTGEMGVPNLSGGASGFRRCTP